MLFLLFICTEPCPAVHDNTDNYYCSDAFPHECGRACYFMEVSKGHEENNTVVKNTILQAKAACAAKGGHLASIRTEEDQKCIMAYTKQATQGMWIGLYEKKIGEDYIWVWETDQDDHPPSTYVNWDASTWRVDRSQKDCLLLLFLHKLQLSSGIHLNVLFIN